MKKERQETAAEHIFPRDRQAGRVKL